MERPPVVERCIISAIQDAQLDFPRKFDLQIELIRLKWKETTFICCYLLHRHVNGYSYIFKDCYTVSFNR